MSDSTFDCPSCNARYKRGSLQAGQRVKCVKCEAIVTIPEDIEEIEELEEVEEIEEEEAEETEPVEAAAPRAHSRASARGRRAGASSRGDRSSRGDKSTGDKGERSSGKRSGRTASKRGSSRRGRPQESESKSKTPLLLGIGGVIVVGVALFFVLNSGGDDQKGQGGAGQSGKQAQSNGASGSGNNGSGKEAPPEKSPKEQLEAALANAEKASESKEKVVQLEAAITLLDDYDIADAGVTKKELYERIIEADTDHAKARRKLGYHRFEKAEWGKSKGKWFTREELSQVTKDYSEWKAAQDAKVAAETEKARWTKDAWTKKVAKARDYFEKDIKPVPDFKLKYFFDMPEVPRPYLLMIEDRESPNPEASAKLYGPALQTLRKTFERAYKHNGVLADWDEDKRIVPILMFGSRKSYNKYRDNGHTHLPKDDSIGAFYVHRSPPEMANLYRGTLFVWQLPNDKQFISTLFHEATHQLMHNACEEARMGDTPWIEEGMAEFWSGYEGNKYAGYKFGRMQKGRWGNCQSIAQAYYKNQRGQGPEAFMTPKRLVHYSREEFDADRSGASGGPGRARMSLTYALGWGFIHFLYNYKDKTGKVPYRDAMEKILTDELRYNYTPEKVEEYLGIKNDEDWKALEKVFFHYIMRTLRGMKKSEYIPGQKKGD